MSEALWMLIWLHFRGWIRFLGNNLKTIRGALLALVGFGVFFLWILAVLFAPTSGSRGIEPDDFSKFGRLMLVAYCLMNVVFTTQERAIYFSPAEVQFLFTGPFSRRQVLGYKIMLTLLSSLPASVIMAMFIRVRDAWFVASLLGLIQIMIFMQLFTMALGLLASSIGEQFVSRSRKVIIGMLILVGGLVYWQARQVGPIGSLPELAEQILQTTAWQIASWPLRFFFDTVLAKSAGELLIPFGMAIIVNFLMVGVIFGLDAHYMEASAAGSARLYARIQRMRGRNAEVEQSAKPGKHTWGVPTIPYMGGVGPILWRQLTSALRGMGRFLFVLVIIGIASIGPMLAAGGQDNKVVISSLIGLAVWMSIFITTIVPFDFRGDLDRMATLKTLPIVPWRLALGQLLTPTLLIAVMQCLALGVIACLAPEFWLALLIAAAYTFPVSFLLIGLENLLFLLFPVRIMAATPGDFQSVGRNVLLAMGKLFGLGVVGAGAGLVGTVVYLVTQKWWLGLLAGLPVVVVCGGILVPLCGLAFQWFDVGRDTPA